MNCSGRQAVGYDKDDVPGDLRLLVLQQDPARRIEAPAQIGAADEGGPIDGGTVNVQAPIHPEPGAQGREVDFTMNGIARMCVVELKFEQSARRQPVTAAFQSDASPG